MVEFCNPAYMGAISVDELVHDGYTSVLSIQLHGIDKGYTVCPTLNKPTESTGHIIKMRD